MPQKSATGSMTVLSDPANSIFPYDMARYRDATEFSAPYSACVICLRSTTGGVRPRRFTGITRTRCVSDPSSCRDRSELSCASACGKPMDIADAAKIPVNSATIGARTGRTRFDVEGRTLMGRSPTTHLAAAVYGTVPPVGIGFFNVPFQTIPNS